MNTNEFQAHTQQIERLVEEVTALSDEGARVKALDLLQEHVQRVEEMRARREALMQRVQKLDQEIQELQQTTGPGTKP